MKDIYKYGWEALGFNSYNNFLLSEFWEKKREIILQEKGRRCETCGSKSNLQVHHLNYLNLGNESKDDVMVLCKKCHKEINKKRDKDDKRI